MSKIWKAVCVAAAGLLTVGAAASTVAFVSRYGYLWGYEDSMEALKVQEAELSTQLAQEEDALKEEETAYNAYVAVTEENTWDRQIRQAFAEGEAARANADMLTLSVLDQVSMVTFQTEDFKETMKDALFDEVIGAASEKVPLDSIITGATQGVSEGIYGYVEGKAKDYLTDMLGADIFAAKDFVDELVGANDVPAVLVNQMAEKQKSRVSDLVEFMGRKERSVQEQRLAADSLYQLIDMEEQVAVAVKRGTTLDKSDVYRQMVEYARQYGGSQYAIRQMAKWKEDTDEK